jgi:hypothetical protein
MRLGLRSTVADEIALSKEEFSGDPRSAAVSSILFEPRSPVGDRGSKRRAVTSVTVTTQAFAESLSRYTRKNWRSDAICCGRCRFAALRLAAKLYG